MKRLLSNRQITIAIAQEIKTADYIITDNYTELDCFCSKDSDIDIGYETFTLSDKKHIYNITDELEGHTLMTVELPLNQKETEKLIHFSKNNVLESYCEDELIELVEVIGGKVLDIKSISW